MNVVTLRDQMVRAPRFSSGFFTAMKGNKAGKKNQSSSMHFYALSYGKGEFFGVENFFEFRDLNE